MRYRLWLGCLLFIAFSCVEASKIYHYDAPWRLSHYAKRFEQVQLAHNIERKNPKKQKMRVKKNSQANKHHLKKPAHKAQAKFVLAKKKSAKKRSSRENVTTLPSPRGLTAGSRRSRRRDDPWIPRSSRGMTEKGGEQLRKNKKKAKKYQHSERKHYKQHKKTVHSNAKETRHKKKKPFSRRKKYKKAIYGYSSSTKNLVGSKRMPKNSDKKVRPMRLAEAEDMEWQEPPPLPRKISKREPEKNYIVLAAAPQKSRPQMHEYLSHDPHVILHHEPTVTLPVQKRMRFAFSGKRSMEELMWYFHAREYPLKPTPERYSLIINATLPEPFSQDFKHDVIEERKLALIKNAHLTANAKKFHGLFEIKTPSKAISRSIQVRDEVSEVDEELNALSYKMRLTRKKRERLQKKLWALNDSSHVFTNK